MAKLGQEDEPASKKHTTPFAGQQGMEEASPSQEVFDVLA